MSRAYSLRLRLLCSTAIIKIEHKQVVRPGMGYHKLFADCPQPMSLVEPLCIGAATAPETTPAEIARVRNASRQQHATNPTITHLRHRGHAAQPPVIISPIKRTGILNKGGGTN